MNFPLRQRWLIMSLVVIASILDFASGDERRKDEGYSGIADKASGEGPQGEISEQNREKKRKWGDNNMRVWGKREDWEKEESDKRDWSKKNMRAWVKRDATEEEEGEKRSWSKTGLRVWRKRDDEGEEEKSKWGDNKVRVWGKQNSEDEKRAWGKRDWDKTELDGEDETEKQTWSNRVRAWGKRSDDDANNDEKSSLKTDSKMADHSSTEERSAIVKRAIESRVKRSSNSDVAPKGPKKSWRTNVIRVWGKRNAL